MAIDISQFDALAGQPIAEMGGKRPASLDQNNTDEKQGGLMGYWRKPGTGEICISSIGLTQSNDFFRRGYTYLGDEWGVFNLANGPLGWKPEQDNFRMLLHRGGITLFPLAQIYEHQWHLRPHPILRAKIEQQMAARDAAWDEALREVIPQLRGETWTVVECKLCPERLFNSTKDLESHEILHRPEKAQRLMGQSIAEAIKAANDGNTALVVTVLQQLTEQNAAMQNMVAVLMQQAGIQPPRVVAPAPAPTVAPGLSEDEHEAPIPGEEQWPMAEMTAAPTPSKKVASPRGRKPKAKSKPKGR